MKSVKVNLGSRSYRILIGVDLGDIGKALRTVSLSGRIMIVTNPRVDKLYSGQIGLSLKAAGFVVFKTVISEGERFKSQVSANRIYQQCLRYGLDRNSTILALGGGVIGDLAGFAASSYLRGINFVQVPTTLLAQVDSSVGGKVGINLPGGKNLIGAFYQPKLVYIDLKVLKTLPAREFANGLAEVIKYGMIYDKHFFAFLEKNMTKNRQADILEKVVTRSCAIKALVVTKDEREKNLRAILNFGHTIGHALEGAAAYKGFTHGEAVAVGMVGAAIIANNVGLADSNLEKKLSSLLVRAGLPVSAKGQGLAWKKLLGFMQKDKKVINERIRFILPLAIGKVTVEDSVPLQVIRQAIAELS